MTTTSQNASFCQTSKFTDLFKVPGLADGNGCTMYDATSDLAFYYESAFIFSGFSKLERCYQMF